MYKQLILNTATLADMNQMTFNLQGNLTCVAFRVVSVCFVQDYDAMDAHNSTIAFKEDGGSVIKAVIKPGTYDSTSIVGAVGDAMTAAGTQRYSVSYNESTRRLTITSSTSPFQVLSAGHGSSAFLQLGLDKSQDTESGRAITLPNTINMSASQPILLTSRTLDANGSVLYPCGVDSGLNVLAAIVPDTMNNVIFWSNPDTRLFTTNGDNNLNTVDFQLVDSSSLQVIPTHSPVVVTLGFYDDTLDLLRPNEA